MRSFFLVLCCLSGIFSTSQKTVDVSSDYQTALSTSFFTVVGGTPFVAKFTKLVEGTPYFRDEWMKGTVVLDGDQQYPGVYLKLDLYDNEVHYRDAHGNETIAATPLKKIILFDTTAQRVFNFVNGKDLAASNSHPMGWYLLLAEGKAFLFKQIKKQLIENRPYGSATVEQSIMTSVHY